MVCILDVVCFAVSCCPAVAERHFGLRIGCCLLRGLLLFGSGRTPFWSAHWIGCCLLRGLLLLGRGVSPFWFAHWMLFASRSVVVRRGQNAILVCALDVVCFAVCCCPAGAYRHSTLRIGGCCSCRLLLLGWGGTPFWSAHWMLLLLRTVVTRQGRNAILVCALGVVCFAVSCCSAGGISPFYSAHWRLLLLQTVVTRQGRIAILVCALGVVCFAVSCCPVVAERHFALHFGHCLLCGLLLPGGGGTPFWSAHWMLFASRSLVARWWRNAI